MPTYEYECAVCKKHFEFFQNINEPPKKVCPDCSGSLKKLIGKGAGIIFKGSGFYATDYRKSKNTSKDSCASCCSINKNQK